MRSKAKEDGDTVCETGEKSTGQRLMAQAGDRERKSRRRRQRRRKTVASDVNE